MWLSDISLENFKPHGKLAIKPRKITILIGPNSTGKTSVLQSLEILKGTLSSNQPHHGIVTSHGPYDFGNIQDLITFGEKTTSIAIAGSKILPHGIESNEPSNMKFGYRLKFDVNGLNEVYFYGEIERRFEITFHGSPNKASCVVFDKPTSEKLKVINAKLEGIIPRFGLSEGLAEVLRNFNDLFSNGDVLKNLMSEFFYIPFHRTATTYGFQLLPESKDIFEHRQDKIVDALISNLSKDPRLLDKIAKFMQNLTGKTIRTRNIDLIKTQGEQGVTLDFVRGGFSNAIINEGTGPNQALLLLAILVGTQKNSVITIDEPEIHLHPIAQSKLAKIMIDLAFDDNKQIIFTTHSEHMLYPFLASIASKEKNSISLNDVAIYYFEYLEKQNLAKVEQLEINEQGQIKGGLKGFWESDLETLADFIGDKTD